MPNARIVKIRPVSWKIVVQDREQAEYVRNVLAKARIETSQPIEEPSLSTPPWSAFIATPGSESPITAVELQSLLAADQSVQVEFDA